MNQPLNRSHSASPEDDRDPDSGWNMRPARAGARRGPGTRLW